MNKSFDNGNKKIRNKSLIPYTGEYRKGKFINKKLRKREINKHSDNFLRDKKD